MLRLRLCQLLTLITYVASYCSSSLDGELDPSHEVELLQMSVVHNTKVSSVAISPNVGGNNENHENESSLPRNADPLQVRNISDEDLHDSKPIVLFHVPVHVTRHNLEPIVVVAGLVLLLNAVACCHLLCTGEHKALCTSQTEEEAEHCVKAIFCCIPMCLFACIFGTLEWYFALDVVMKMLVLIFSSFTSLGLMLLWSTHLAQPVIKEITVYVFFMFTLLFFIYTCCTLHLHPMRLKIQKVCEHLVAQAEATENVIKNEETKIEKFFGCNTKDKQKTSCCLPAERLLGNRQKH